MDSTRSRRVAEKDEYRRRRRSRSRSNSEDEEERQRRRRRREREEREEREGGDSRRDRDRDRKRRRSRSPGYESSRRKYDEREPKHRSRGERSPDRDTKKENEVRSSREASENQISRKNKGPLPSQEASFMSNKDPSKALVPGGEAPEKQKPNFAPTGLLAAASNQVEQADGTKIVLKYHEPAGARKPPAKEQWKLFVFKGADIVDTIDLNARSCWLVGRELAVVDMPAEHPSISKQHAVIQFRFIEKRNEFGDKLGKVRPYLIDLDSANGTLLNKEEVPGSRYLELRDKDMIQFGHSTREYVLMLSKD